MQNKSYEECLQKLLDAATPQQRELIKERLAEHREEKRKGISSLLFNYAKEETKQQILEAFERKKKELDEEYLTEKELRKINPRLYDQLQMKRVSKILKKFSLL